MARLQVHGLEVEARDRERIEEVAEIGSERLLLSEQKDGQRRISVGATRIAAFCNNRRDGNERESSRE
jgi:hypothetical protein